MTKYQKQISLKEKKMVLMACHFWAVAFGSSLRKNSTIELNSVLDKATCTTEVAKHLEEGEKGQSPLSKGVSPLMTRFP